MNISHHSTRYRNFHNKLFILLFLIIIGLLGFLSTRYVYLADWTVNSQNSLNEITLKLLDTLEGPIDIVSYTNNSQLKEPIKELIARYQRIKPDISLSFENPIADPEKMRTLNIRLEGEMRISYEGRQENLAKLSEQDLSNTLYRLLRSQERTVLFVQGHGERSPTRQANFDLSNFSSHLKKQGFLLGTLNLAKSTALPDNISILVIASPRTAFLPGEVSRLIAYVNSGGNLLWLGDPLDIKKAQPMYGLLALSELLGIEFLDGVVVDPTTEQYSISRPDYAIVTDYPEHPINQGFDSVTLFPQATGIERLPTFLNKEETLKEKEATEHEDSDENNAINSPFEITPFLLTAENSWLESSPITGNVHYSELLDIGGPISIGMTMQRQTKLKRNKVKEPTPKHTKEQRIVVLGDGDFLSNTFLGNAGNLDLGLNIFNWLSHDEQFIAIPGRIKNDIILDLSPTQLSFLGMFFLLVIPALLILSGTLIWFRRRNR